MGWGSVLGILGGAALAPFTAGTSMAWMPAVAGAVGGAADQIASQKKQQNMLGGIGAMASGAAQGAQAGRIQQDLANASIYNSQVGGVLGQGQLDLQRRMFAERLGPAQAGDITRAGLLNSISDVSLGGPGRWKASGGVRPSALPPEVRQALQLLIAQKMKGLQAGPQLMDLKMPTAPQQTQAGFGEKLLGGVGLAGGIGGSILSNLPINKPALPSNPVPFTPISGIPTPGTPFQMY